MPCLVHRNGIRIEIVMVIGMEWDGMRRNDYYLLDTIFNTE